MNANIKNVLIFVSACIGFCSLHAKGNVLIQEVVYGTSFTGSKLTAYKVFKEGDFQKRRMALLTDGIHGNEYMGIGQAVIEKIQQETTKGNKLFSSFFDKGGIFLIVPKVNPDGVLSKSRFSSLGSDLNRDFNVVDKKRFFSEQETFYLDQLVRSEVNRGSQLILAVDYHCCAKSLLHPQVVSSSSMGELKNVYHNVFSLMKKDLGGKFILGTSSNVLGEELPGTMKNYWHKEFGTISFTFEGHIPGVDQNQSLRHYNWWGSLLSFLSELPHQMVAQLETIPEPSDLRPNELSRRLKRYSE